MRNVQLILLACVLLFACQAKVLCDAAKPDVKKLTKEYLEKSTAEERRSEIVFLLRAAQPSSLKSEISAALKNNVSGALALAAALKVQGLLRDVRKLFDSPERQSVLGWIMRSTDPEGIEFLFGRWKEAGTDSEEFSAVDTAFRSGRLPVECLDKLLKDYLGDSARGSFSRAILNWQLGLGDKAAEDLRSDWKELRAAYLRESRTLPMTGEPLLDSGNWVKEKCTRVGDNYRLEQEGRLVLDPLPFKIASRTTVLKVRVCVLSGNGAKVRFAWGRAGAGGGFAALSTDKTWDCEAAAHENIRSVPLTVEKWMEIRFNHELKKGGRWRVDLLVDDKPIIENGESSKEAENIEIVSGNARVLISSIELQLSGGK